LKNRGFGLLPEECFSDWVSRKCASGSVKYENMGTFFDFVIMYFYRLSVTMLNCEYKILIIYKKQVEYILKGVIHVHNFRTFECL
jgi:hypothetical protein